MSEPHREHDTLKAIQNLQNEYPFATGLLIYCLIERMLKYFIRDEIKKAPSRLEENFCEKNKHKKDRALRKRLIRLTLESIVYKFKYKNDKEILKEIAERRNNYMHSNDLLEPVVEKNPKKRGEYHKKDLQQAIKDLKSIFDLLKEDYEIVIDHNGNLGDFRSRQYTHTNS